MPAWQRNPMLGQRASRLVSPRPSDPLLTDFHSNNVGEVVDIVNNAVISAQSLFFAIQAAVEAWWGKDRIQTVASLLA